MLITAAFNAPLIAINPRNTDLLHAVTMEGVIARWSKRTMFAACGAKGLKLLHIGDRYSIPWPPRVSSLSPTMTRCLACQKATGNPRPRCAFKAREAAS